MALRGTHSQLPVSGWEEENELVLLWPVQPCWRSWSLMFILIPGKHMDIVLPMLAPKPGFAFPAQPTLLCVEPEQPTGSQLCPSGDGDKKPAFPLRHHIPEKPHTPRVLPAGSGETSCLLPPCPSRGQGKCWESSFPGHPAGCGLSLGTMLGREDGEKIARDDGVGAHASSSSA